MQVSRHSMAPGEIDHELLWLLISFGTLTLAAFWFAARLPTPQCAFHSLTGLPCPTCGATRAAYQFLHGHFAASFFFNPLAFLAYCTVIAFDLYAVMVLMARAPRFRLKNFSGAQKLFLRSLAIALLLGNWFYLLATRS